MDTFIEILAKNANEIILAQILCGPYETPKLCRNKCEQTCSNVILGVIASHPCISDCERGCDCLPGYVRNNIGICVAIETCSKFFDVLSIICHLKVELF